MVKDYEADLLPAPFLLKEMHRLIKDGSEESLKEARLIAVSVAPFYHPKLASKHISNEYEVGDRLAALMREIDGKRTIIGPPVAVKSPLSDNRQERIEDAVFDELGSGSSSE